MDPNATLRDLLEAAAAGDRVAYADCLYALLGWYVSKGCLPEPAVVCERWLKNHKE